METVTLLYEDYQKELAEDFKNTFLKRASDTDSSRSNDAVIDEVTDMLSTNIAVYTEKLLRQWGFSSGGEGGSGGGDVTVTLDDLLQKYLEDNYVTIKGDQEVYGEKDFRKGIRIAGRRLYWDESNDALVIEGAAYTTRWLSAYGMSPGGGGAGSGGAAAMYQLIDVSPNDTKDAVLGAEKDYVLTFDGNFWRGMPNKGGLSSKLFTALDKDGNEVNPDDENSEIYAIRANYSLWSVGFLSAKGISDGGAGGGGGGAVALYQLLDVEKNSDITGVAGATKGSVLTFNGDKWYADKPKTAEGINRLFSALDADGNEVDPSDDTKTIASIRANFGFWGVDYISAKGVSKGSGGTGGASTLYQLVDVLANDTEDGVEGAAAGKALVFDGTHWRAGDAGLNESQLYSYLTANKYLTQSAADSRYVTSSRKVIAGTGLSGGGALTSDVTLSLGTSGVVAGTYTKVMVDAYGRVTSGTNLSATDIPNLDWSKITTGKPTTLAGYGITDAVTLTTAQTISGRKTFSQNIVFNNNGGITYTDSNVVLRNSDGHTILASFGNGEINLRPNGHNNTEGAVWINKAGNVQAPSVSTNTITIGDAQLVYDSKNKALRVKHRTDGNTVGFYSDGWITALGVQTGGAGGGSGVIKTVYSFANLTDGTTFSDSDLNNTFNAYTVKEIWKMAKEGGGIKNIAQSGSGNAITDMTLSSDGKTITAVFGETFARQQDLGTLNNTVTQLSNKLNNFLEGLTGNDTLTELLALKADKTITISAGTGLTGGGNLSANRTLSLATTGVKAGTYTKVTVDTYGRVTVGDNPTTLAGYGITDAYTKTEADGKYVTIATPQTITGQKTFTKNIAMNSGIGLSYSGNTVFRNTSGNTVISSYGDSGMLYFRPNGDTSDVGVVQINKQGHINGVSAGFKGGVSAARLSATEYVQIGDAYLKWDAANNAVYVIKKDGTTPVGFYSTDWLSAKGVSMSGAQTGTLDSLNDVEITDPVNGQALKYDAASKKWVNGTIDSFNVNQMWAELKKADSSKVIDASHIPTSVLDGRWVTISTNQNITGQKTFTQQLKSTVATGLSPLIVSSNTTVDNLSADLLDGYHAFGTSNALIKYGYTVGGTEPAWCRIATYSIRDTGIMTDVCFVLHSAFDDLFGILVIRTRGGSYVQGLLIASYNINTSNIRIYHDAEKRNIELYCHGGNNYSVIQANLLYSHDRYGEANTAITLYRGDTKAPSWSTYVNPGFVNLQNSSDVAKKLQTPRTLWGQSFDGTANVSGNMTGVGSITMSGDLKIGNGTSPNTIYFYGTTGDSPGGYNHTFIAERLWGGTESSELVLFKGNDLGNGNEAVKSNSGPDRIRHIAAAHLFQTYTSTLAGSVEDVCTSSALKSLFGIAANRVTSYVPFMSTVASGTAPFIVVSNTVVGNLNADLLDGVHLAGLSGREGVMRSWRRGRYTTVNQYFGNGNVVTIDPKPTDDATLSPNTTVLSLGDLPTRNTQLAFHYDTNTIKYRRHDDSKWNDWVVLIHSGNYASYSDGRYVKKSGDTMTGDLTMGGGHMIYLAQASATSTQHIRLQGGSNDYGRIAFGATAKSAGWMEIASCDDGNEPIYVRQYTGEFTSIKRTATLLDASGNTSFPGSVTSVRHISTVGTGTQPYQCSSTTLNTNLNADLLDNWHIMDIPRNYNSTATYSLQFALGGTDNGWKKIFACSESGAGPYRSVTVWGRIWYAYGNHAQEEVRYYHFCAIFYMRSGPSSSDSSVGNVENSARLYLPTFAKGMDNIRLVRVGTNNFELQVRQIGSYHNGHIQYQYWAYGANVSAWRGLQSTSNTSVAVSAGGASTLADSRASSADVWTSARTFYIQDHNAANTGAGVSVNGSANVYLKLPNSIQCSDWFRSTGNSGWYHQNYGGGIYMQDSTWVRVYGGKRFYVSNVDNSDFSTHTAISTEGGIYARKNITSSANIFANGAITAKASSSDIRLKTDIQGYDAMGIIRKFRSVKYHWNAIAKENSEVFNHDNWNYGLIAQDLLSGGYSQWVSDIFKDYYTIDYERLIPVVWKGLQEVDDEVTKLRKEVVRLNKRISELEKFLCA